MTPYHKIQSVFKRELRAFTIHTAAAAALVTNQAELQRVLEEATKLREAALNTIPSKIIIPTEEPSP